MLGQAQAFSVPWWPLCRTPCLPAAANGECLTPPSTTTSHLAPPYTPDKSQASVSDISRGPVWTSLIFINNYFRICAYRIIAFLPKANSPCSLTALVFYWGKFLPKCQGDCWLQYLVFSGFLLLLLLLLFSFWQWLEKIPWMEESGRLQSMGSLESDTTERLHFHFSLSCIGEGNGNPFQCSCLENPRDEEAWWAVYGVAQLKRLSSSSSSRDIQIPISLTWDRTWSSGSESMESYPLDCQGVPTPCFLWTSNLDNSLPPLSGSHLFWHLLCDNFL